QNVERDRRSGIDDAGIHRLLNAAQIDLVILSPERLVEPALRQPPMQRHLAALESVQRHTRTGPLPFDAAAGCLAFSGSDSAPDAFAKLSRSRIVLEIAELHLAVLSGLQPVSLMAVRTLAINLFGPPLSARPAAGVEPGAQPHSQLVFQHLH